MIRYRLGCPKRHEFEGWFASGDAFDVQIKKKQVQCPVCGSTKVAKALMAPSVVTSEQKIASRKHRKAQPADVAVETADTARSAAPAASRPQIAPSPEQREAMKQLKELRDKVLAKSDYVGPRFADEARRIHEGGKSERGIHGEASLDDVKALVEDGIEVYPVPVLPDDQN